MIPRKKKICKECGNNHYLFSNGACKSCATKIIKTQPIKTKAKKNKMDLDNFFIQKIEQLLKLGKSEESGKAIFSPTRANICHILDKSRHPSVAYHPQNYVFLTVDEHSRFDQLLFAHRFEDLKKEFPNSWGKVLERLSYFINDCLENTKLKTALLKLI